MERRSPHGRNMLCILATVVCYCFPASRCIHSLYSDMPITGAVSTDNFVCSRIGARVLSDGGNAMDAAVASTLCLGVSHRSCRILTYGTVLQLLFYPKRWFLPCQAALAVAASSCPSTAAVESASSSMPEKPLLPRPLKTCSLRTQALLGTVLS